MSGPSGAAPELPQGFRLIALGEAASTNDEARRLAADAAADGTVVWATAQTAGRGRYGRSWVSPPGNLYASLIVRPRVAPTAGLQLGFVSAVAAAEALERHVGGGTLALKWPNDVILNGRKLAGMLLESATGPGGLLDWLVVGIGVNLVSHPEGTPFPSTSLAGEGGAVPTPGALLAEYCARFRHWRGRWETDGFAPVRAAWLRRAYRLGEAVAVRLEGERCAGRFVDLDQAGALVLQQTSGESRRITFGEVFPLHSEGRACCWR